MTFESYRCSVLYKYLVKNKMILIDYKKNIKVYFSEIDQD